MTYPHGSIQSISRDGFGRRVVVTAAVPHGVSRGLFVAVLGIALVFAAWAGLASAYVLFRDDALKALISRQVSTNRNHDVQIAALEAELAQLRSAKFVDQDRIERQLAELARMQRTIEARHGALAALAQTVPDTRGEITGSIPKLPPAAKEQPPAHQLDPDAKPRPISDIIHVEPPSNASVLQSRSALLPVSLAPTMGSDAENEIAALAQKLSRLGADQANALNALETRLDDRLARTRRVLDELGLARRPAMQATGGPFIPVHEAPEDPFARQIYRVRHTATAIAQGNRQFEGIPVLPPLFGAIEVTSGYGRRLDPFLRQLALHSGVDLRGTTGDPVRAAASGTITFAGSHAGYGLMVEVDHGNGLSTRYAHLSKVIAKEGTRVSSGTIVGEVGSTGRSTGPHLHFEVRSNGEAVDPQRYLRAGLRLTEIR